MPIKIYVDQGHNPRDYNTGAEGNGFFEQDLTYEIGRRLYALLESNPEPYLVYYTNTKNSYRHLSEPA